MSQFIHRYYLKAWEAEAEAAKQGFHLGTTESLLEWGKIIDPLITTITVAPKQK